MTRLAPHVISFAVFLLLVLAPSGEAAAVRTTRCNVDTTPTGAQVFLVAADGEKLLGLAPLKKVRLPRGMTTLRMVKEGFEDLVETVEIGYRRQSFVFNLIRKIMPATLEFIGAAESKGATITVDGKAIGQVPGSTEVPPGRHHVIVKKDGFQDWERWVDTTEKQKLTFDVVMKPLAEGGLLITTRPSGADILINGAPRGKTPSVVEGLAPGQYLVELRLEKYQPHQQTIEVSGKKKIVVDVQLEPAGGGAGTIHATADVEGAVILLDGEELGPAPITKADVQAGKHVLEARMQGYATDKREVVVKHGETTTAAMSLKAATQRARAGVRVIANVPGATVSIDNGEAKPAPFQADDLTAGTHFVVVSAKGYANWEKSVTLKSGETQEVVAQLTKAGRLEVSAKGGASEVFLNGKLIGKTPLIMENIETGTYEIVVKRADGEQEKRTVAIGTAKAVKLKATFGANKKRPRHRAMTMSAQASDVGHGTVDFHSGWPWLFGLRLNVGVIPDLETGLAIRSALDTINEFEGKAKYLIARTRALTAAVEAGIGFGLGGKERNAFFMRAGVLGSVMIAERAAVTAHVGVHFHSDRTGPEDVEAHVDRDSGLQLLLGVSIEFKWAKYWNAFLYFEGDPIGSGRKLYDQGFAVDTKAYGIGGISYLF